MSTTEFLEVRGIKNARKLNEKERKSICLWILQRDAFETPTLAKAKAKGIGIKLEGFE